MKIRISLNWLTAVAAVVASFYATSLVSGEEISFQNVPLNDAIKVLARQRQPECNFILDPKLSGIFDADGKPIQQPTVTLHLENIAYEQALNQILTEHGLILIGDPVTTVARITFTNQLLKKAEAKFLAGDTNAPIPVMVFDSTPMDVAIKHIAEAAHLEVALGAKISDGYRTAGGDLIRPPTVSLRWQKLTARQALLALCLNYDLVVIVDEQTGVWRIGMRP